jgi:alpha-glucosidase
VNDGEDYMPGPGADPTKPVDGLDMQQVCDYARSKGVGVRVWAHWAALWPKMEEAFIQYEKWGIDGLMIDFMDRDDQEMVNMQTEMLERAAEYHLHVQFHGAYKPTGLHRTYPNEFTREGTLNYEVCKWDTIVTPDHDLDIIYARMLAGASDYHLGGFRAVPKDQFTVRFEKPSVIGTRCHMLGMFVVLESYLGLVCDYPEAYEGQPGFGFVTRVPTVWDETRFLNGQISEYITLARRKGPVWFVGSVNNSTERKISLPFDFLPQGEYVVEIYSDCPETAKDANRLKKQTRTIKPGDTVNIQLASGGGAAAYIKSNSSD